MPNLDSKLHLIMLRNWSRKRGLSEHIQGLFGKFLGSREKPSIYGLHWGDPQTSKPLAHIRDHFLLPYLGTDKVVLEIGPGGGRWTRYMLDAKRVYAVDYHQELLEELRKNFHRDNIIYIKNNGMDFPGIPAGVVDLIFSFGTFVHLDRKLISAYLKNMKLLLKKSTVVVLQYSDKTKEAAKNNKDFSNNTPDIMRDLVIKCGYSIQEEDLVTLPHSSVIRFGL